MRISVIVPVFNERQSILEVIRRVEEAPFEKEIIIVDDCSTDGTADILRQINNGRVRVFFHKQNQGKGVALRTGFQKAKNDILIIQDADLEYDPRDYPRLLEPILDGRADVVYGSRFVGEGPHRVVFFWHMVGNKLLTFLSNMLTNLTLTDMETCYKAFTRQVLEQITLEEDRFGFEPEFTAKVAKLGVRIYEIGISYSGRGYKEGKKIKWKDGFSAIRCIIRYNCFG